MRRGVHSPRPGKYGAKSGFLPHRNTSRRRNMTNANDGTPDSSPEARQTTSIMAPGEATNGTPAARANTSALPDKSEAPRNNSLRASEPTPAAGQPRRQRWRRWLLLTGAVAGLALGVFFLVPRVDRALNRVSTGGV